MDQCWRRQDQEVKQQQRKGYFDEDIYDFEGKYRASNEASEKASIQFYLSFYSYIF